MNSAKTSLHQEGSQHFYSGGDFSKFWLT